LAGYDDESGNSNGSSVIFVEPQGFGLQRIMCSAGFGILILCKFNPCSSSTKMSEESKISKKEKIDMRRINFFVICIIVLLFGNSVVCAQSHSIMIIELNNEQEYVLIKNEGEAAVNLKGWILHDHDYGKTKIYSYTFLDIQLKPGEILQMQSGKTKKEQKATPTPGKLEKANHYILWANRKVWNDRCDIAYLLDNNGNPVDEKQNGGDLEDGKKENCQ
jgi:hypothetical protein